MKSIRTKHLILRNWQEEDFEPFANMNADPKVMEFFPATLTRTESDALAKKFIDHIQTHGWGPWAISAPDAPFIGFVGIKAVHYLPHIPEAVEIGWRLAYPYWGRGYAAEAALAALEYGFKTLHLNEIVAFTVEKNVRSRKVMEKIGMTHDPKDDFHHPALPKDHPLSWHVLYRKRNTVY